MGKREELKEEKAAADQGKIMIGNKLVEPSDGDTSWTKPSKQYERMSDNTKKSLQARLGKTNINFIIKNQQAIDSFFADPKSVQPGGPVLDARVSNFMEIISKDPILFYEAALFYPNIKRTYDKWNKWVTDYTKNAKEAEEKQKSDKPSFEEYMKSFTNDDNVSFQKMTDHLETAKRISEWISKHERPDTPPQDPNPWEMRIGASKFVVPPVNVQVSQQFGTGSMTGGVLRQQNTPKFNTGHSDTVINVTLYFPNHEAIWGLGGLGQEGNKSGLVKDINFEEASDREIDSFLSSLRGLITQFKYAPILPIRNDFLNRTYNISAVCMQSMTVQTLENYPYCLTVNLQMIKFNHKVFLPMIKDFNQAIHWGRFRQYMGKAAQWISGNVSKGFLLETKQPDGTSKVDIENPFSTTFNVYKELGLTPAVDVDIQSVDASNKTDWSDVSRLKLYYPIKTPAKVFVPDTLSWHQYGEDSVYQTESDAWSNFLSGMGFQPVTETQSFYDYLEELGRTSNTSGQAIGMPNDRQLLLEYLRISAATVNEMTQDKMNEFLNKMSESRKKEDPNWDSNKEAKEKAISDWKTMWYFHMFNLFHESPLWRIRELQLKNRAEQRIEEWAVPMEELQLDWNNIYVHGTAVSISNNFARLQLQMQDEPTFQHIGGGDSQISVSLTVFGEDNLIRLRRLFDHINGLARLEHSHGVLGFLGIKNLVTALCGIKHIIPLNFETETIPNYPHVYTVRLSFVDFDVTQQRREELSTAQQRELVEAFGTKRNPFLRVKQLWGAFNAYPDFPLHITDDEGKIIGHLEPDYYYKAFSTIDDDLVNPDLHKRPNAIGVAADQVRKLIDEGNPEGKKNIEPGKDGSGKRTGSTATTSGNPFWPQKKDASEPPATGQEGDTTAPPMTTDSSGEIVKGAESTGSSLEQIDNLSGAASLMVKNFFPIGGENKDKAGAIYNVAGNLAGVNIDTASGKANIGLEWSTISEDYAARTLEKSHLEGFTPNSHYSKPLHSEDGFSEGDPAIHWQKMLVDSQYRDISGRMVRAYPTFMLWLIDEGGNFAGVKLFDNFYGLQSVIDFSVSSSEDVLGDTLVLRVSNLYSKLTSDYKLYAGKHDGTTPESDLVDKLFIGEDNLISGTTNEIREIGQIRLKPGVRVHLRAGYSANPNLLRTIFNGTITQVTQGDIVEIVAQSDAIELAPYVNTTDSKGDSNGIDGAQTGMWLSEPRDLMVKLLSMGSSTFREAVANATQGMIFSENKFGIRHFGQVLYEPLNNEEEDLHNKRYDAVKSALDGFIQDPNASAGPASFTNITPGGFDSMLGSQSQVRSGAIPLMQMLATNFFRNRDYEVFKRNIYPGNGTGVAQYLGGDFPEAGLIVADASGSDTQSISPLPTPKVNNMRSAERAQGAKKTTDKGQNPKSDSQREEIEKQNRNNNPIASANDGKPTEVKPKDPNADLNNATDFGALTALGGVLPTTGWALFKGFGSIENLQRNPLLQMLGIESATEDDLAGFDEISFRAQTYMKSVWDLFQLCAALLPNYIVAVRPFEDRSTVFYGKPHWLYTSGVIPITAGLPKDSTKDFIKPNKELQETLRKLENIANPLSDFQDQQDLISSLGKVNNLTTGASAVSGKKADGSTNKAKVWNLLLQKGASIGLGPAQVAGLMGNMDAETGSTFDPGIIEKSGGGGYGLVQWTASRRTNIENFAKENGKAPDDLEMQIDFVIKELTGPFKSSTLDPIVKINDVREITKIIMKYYESPANQSTEAQDDRANRAEAIYNEFQNSSSAENVTNPTPVAPTAENSGVLPGQVVSPLPGFSGKDASTEDVASYINGIKKIIENKKGYLPGAMVSVWSPNTTGVAENFAEYGPGKSNWADDPVGHFSRLLYDRKYAHDIAQSRKEHPEDIQSLGADFKDKTDMNFDKVFDLGELEVFAAGKDLNPGEDPPPGAVAIVAEKIWDEFRNNWLLGNENFPRIEEGFKKSPWANEKDVAHFGNKANEEPTEDNTLFTMGEDEYWKQAEKDGIKEDFGANDKFKFIPTKLVGGFRKFLWTNAYARAWLVVTTGFHTNWIEGIADAMKGGENALPENLVKLRNVITPGAWIIGKIAEQFGDSNNANAQKIQGQIKHLTENNLVQKTNPAMGFINEFINNGMLCDFENSTVIKAWPVFLELAWAAETAPTWESLEGRASIAKQYLQKVQSKIANVEFGKDPEQTNYTKGWEEIIINPESVYAQAMLKWLDDNKEPGNKSTSPLAKLGGELSRKYDQTIGRLLNVAGNTLQGLIAQFRMQMFQMGHGLSMVGNMQRQAHILNKILDDSIYYAAGPEGSILRMADNPFTREYGEPVIEIREPFQRMHYIDSFQHILNNGLQENLSGVATVVTASSDGKYPVTAYFDKGAPSHLQVEKAVETGLYWDNINGEGFFSFLHPLLNPIEYMKGYAKTAQGSSDEMLSKRVALYHLRESLKDIYTGEILVLGNPDIRTHDLVYIADVYERIYGMVEVEEVVHHFTPDMGFITSITPNALVTVQDPNRWAMHNWMTSVWGSKNIRDDARNMLQVYSDDSSLVRNTNVISSEELADSLGPQMLGKTIYTGGSSALMKDVLAAKASGFLMSQQQRLAYLQKMQEFGKQHEDGQMPNPLKMGTIGMAIGSVTDAPNIASDPTAEANMKMQFNQPVIGPFIAQAWDLAKWIKENLMDQHDCYIQFLTKDGQAMDAGLSYSQGLVVGSFNTVNILPNILGLQSVTPDPVTGAVRITTNDLLERLGWTQYDAARAYREMSWWIAQTNADVLEASGGISSDVNMNENNIAVSMATVVKVIDGDTIAVAPIGGQMSSAPRSSDGFVHIRLIGAKAYELPDKENPTGPRVSEDHPGLRGKNYLVERLINYPRSQGWEPIVAIRQDKANSQDAYKRQLGVVFSNVASTSIDSQQRAKNLEDYAKSIPPIPWNSYLDNGQPYTINWEIIMAGLADVDTYSISDKPDEIRGASLINPAHSKSGNPPKSGG